MIFIVVKWSVRPEHSESWLTVVEPFTQATRAEAGNIFFEWSRSVDDPNVYYLIEAFTDGSAEAHVTSAHSKAATELLPDFVASTPSIISLRDIPGDGWGEMAEIHPR